MKTKQHQLSAHRCPYVICAKKNRETADERKMRNESDEEGKAEKGEEEKEVTKLKKE